MTSGWEAFHPYDQKKKNTTKDKKIDKFHDIKVQTYNDPRSHF